MLTTAYNTHPEKYLGSYYHTEDFRFQEDLRKLDLALYGLVKEQFGKQGELFFSNGWSDIITAAYLLEKNSTDIKISEVFAETIKNEIKKSLEKARGYSNPFIELSVRDNAKTFLMYPHAGHFIPFQTMELKEPIEALNQFVKQSDCRFEYVREWEDMCFIIDEVIFDRLWNSNFEQTLTESGYIDFKRSTYMPHITLIRADDLPKVKELFYERFGREKGEMEFVEYFSSFVERMNEKMKSESSSLIFNELCSTYCEDYAPYEQVVVAKFKSPIIEKSIAELFKELEAKFQKRPDINPKTDGLHLTLAIRFREKSHELNDTKIEEILGQTGDFKEDLETFWNFFLKA